MKLYDIITILNSPLELTHICYNVTLIEMREFERVLGGNVEEDIFKGNHHRYTIERGGVTVILHSLFKDFKL